MNNKIRVVMVEPGKKAYEKEIGTSLYDLQAIVGGLIEPFYPFEEEVCIVCNDEGKLLGLPLNRVFRDEETGEIIDFMAGTFFICDCRGESFGSLNDDQVKRYLKLYEYPEEIILFNGKICAIKYDPDSNI